MSKSISNLLQFIGDDNVIFQPLDQAIIGYQKKRGTNEFTFGSSMDVDQSRMPFEISTEKMGIVVWLDREKVKQCTAIQRKNGLAEVYESDLLNLKLALQACVKSKAISQVGGDYEAMLATLDELLP